MKLKHRGKNEPTLFLPRILFLAVFFVAGTFLGQVFARRVSVVVGQELTEYLKQYILTEHEHSVQMVLSAVVLYLRYPFLAVLFGFASIGVLLIPGMTVLFGFLVSFSVSCFVAAFGMEGVFLSLAAYGIRCVVTLPCYFLLAVPALENAVVLARLSFGRRQHGMALRLGRSWWMRLLICLVILLLSVCVDFMISPLLLQWGMEQFLI